MAKKLLERSVFDAELVNAQRLLESGGLWWRLASRGLIARIDGDRVGDYFSGKDDSRKSFEKALFNEVVPYLNEALAGNKPTWSMTFGDADDEPSEPDREPAVDKKARREERKSRVEAVAKAFANPELRERVLVRRTSKGLALDEIRWDIRTKQHDLKEGQLSGVSFATLEFVLSRKPDMYAQPLGFLDVFGVDTTSSVQVDLHIQDLDGMIRDLQVLRENLAATRKTAIGTGEK